MAPPGQVLPVIYYFIFSLRVGLGQPLSPPSLLPLVDFGRVVFSSFLFLFSSLSLCAFCSVHWESVLYCTSTTLYWSVSLRERAKFRIESDLIL